MAKKKNQKSTSNKDAKTHSSKDMLTEIIKKKKEKAAYRMVHNPPRKLKS